MKYITIIFSLFFSYSIILSQTNINISNWPLFDGEQNLTVNPSNPNNLICAWMQLKANLKIAIAIRSSSDGGATWSSTYIIPNIIPQFTMADPAFAFSRNGTAYLCYIEFGGTGSDSGVVAVVKSTNGGLNWSSPVIVRGAKETNDLAIDRPWIAIDNSQGPRDGYLCVSSMPTAWAPFPQALHLKYSSNGGTTWSSDILVSSTIYPGFHGSMGIMNVTQNGALNIVYVSAQGTNPTFAFAKTTDLGQTFSRNHFSPFYNVYDTLYQNSWTLTSDPANPLNLNLLFTGKINTDPDIFLVRSGNGGNNWSVPLRINNDAINNGIGQDMIWSFQVNGMLGAAWRDRRNGTPGSSSPFDVYFSFSTDGGLTFSNDTRVTNQTSPFNINNVKGNDFLGFVIANNKAHITWGDLRNGNLEIYYNNTFVTSIKNVSTEVPENFALEQNYPNPFNPTTKIRFQVAKTPLTPLSQRGDNVRLVVFDVLGREVATLVNEQLQAGTYEVDFDGSNFASGVYYYTLNADPETSSGFIETKKMVLIK